MAQYYLTLPNSVTLPTDGNKVSLTTACELHRDDSAVPNALTVTNGTYNLFLTSEPVEVTAAATGITPVFLDSGFVADTASTNSHTISGLDASGQVGTATIHVLVFSWASSSTSVDITSVSIDSNSATFQDRSNVGQGSNGHMEHWTLTGVDIGASVDVVIGTDVNIGNPNALGVAMWAVPTATTFTHKKQAYAARTVLDFSENVSGGEGIIAAIFNVNGTDPTWAGATENFATDTRSNEWFSAATAAEVTAATPRTITATQSGSVSCMGLAVILAP